jgi:hypothetical protein
MGGKEGVGEEWLGFMGLGEVCTICLYDMFCVKLPMLSLLGRVTLLGLSAALKSGLTLLTL